MKVLLAFLGFLLSMYKKMINMNKKKLGISKLF